MLIKERDLKELEDRYADEDIYLEEAHHSIRVTTLRKMAQIYKKEMDEDMRERVKEARVVKPLVPFKISQSSATKMADGAKRRQMKRLGTVHLISPSVRMRSEE
mmetsp:Transcript_28085/g.71592  ORF Transcript_28085/g.71592 Transcript_28085/m.71592 type:complete len:104 (+) Transcript_28085:2041-2352(+)